MKIRLPIFASVLAATLAACSSDQVTGPPPPPTQAGVLPKDVEYDAAGKISSASFASGLATYSLHYQSDRIQDIDVAAGTVHKLLYTYDDAGRVAAIRDRDETGANAQLWFFTYEGDHLTAIERD